MWSCRPRYLRRCRASPASSVRPPKRALVSRPRPGSRTFHVGRVLARPRQACELDPLVEGVLSGDEVRLLALPCVKCRLLQRARKRETQFPRMRTHVVHGVEVGRSVTAALSSGKEDDAWDRGRNDVSQAADGLLGDLLGAHLL